jgi:FlaA1/EpsC-like NDP-sugar epimerase
MMGGEIYIKKIPSMKIIEIASCINPNAKYEIIGIRPGEKLHEEMISVDESYNTYEFNDYFKILPVLNKWNLDTMRIKKGKLVTDRFSYTSDKNTKWMSPKNLRSWIEKNKNFLD